MPASFQYWTTARTMVAMLWMPRLPTPMATRAPGFRRRGKVGGGELAAHLGRDVRNPAIGKFLANQQQARKLHARLHFSPDSEVNFGEVALPQRRAKKKQALYQGTASAVP